MKAKIWCDFQRGGVLGYFPSGGVRVWHFLGFGYWAEADTFDRLMEFVRELVS